MKYIVDTKYSELYATSVYVELEDEFDPFLRPSQYADYSDKSACVLKADELAAESTDANDFITNVYKFVCKKIKYDKKKAQTVQSGYIPDPDETMETGKGICIDYASLAAAMLRSHGIPTKIIFGYVGEDGDLYHAWNMYYTKESGWVAVEFEVHEDEWDIRTPLNAIIGYTTLAGQEGVTEEEKSEYVDKIEMASRQLLDIVNDVLDMSRIESGKFSLEPTRVNLENCVREVCDLVRIQLEAKKSNYPYPALFRIHGYSVIR